MSWSISLTITDKDGAYGAIEAQAEEYFATLGGDGVQEMAEQAVAAADAVRALLDAIGTEGPWFVSLSGHANPGHGKRDGRSNDATTISVTER